MRLFGAIAWLFLVCIELSVPSGCGGCPEEPNVTACLSLDLAQACGVHQALAAQTIPDNELTLARSIPCALTNVVHNSGDLLHVFSLGETTMEQSISFDVSPIMPDAPQIDVLRVAASPESPADDFEPELAIRLNGVELCGSSFQSAVIECPLGSPSTLQTIDITVGPEARPFSLSVELVELKPSPSTPCSTPFLECEDAEGSSSFWVGASGKLHPIVSF